MNTIKVMVPVIMDLLGDSNQDADVLTIQSSLARNHTGLSGRRARALSSSWA